MTGSLQVKNNKFYMVLNVYETGNRKRKWISTGLEVKGNKRRAEQMLRETLQDFEKKTQKVQSDVLLSDYIRSWLAIARRHVDEVTYQGYELMANAQVLPYFEKQQLKLRDVTYRHLQAFFDEKRQRGRKDGKGGLSPSSLRQYKNILNQTLNEAVKQGLISSNPCQFVELPKKERYESSYYNAAQLQQLFTAIQGDPIYPLVKITALYGLRRSEVLGIQWDSVDFESGRLIIKHTVSRVTKTVSKDKTKNAASRRSFPLTEEARQIFLAAKQAELENKHLFGKGYHENEYVFKWPDGDPLKPEYVSAHFAKLLKRYDLPRIRFHELRHSCASLLLNHGHSLKDVQEWLGHADIQMTANIYGHIDIQRKQGMADTLSGSLFRTK